MPPGATASWITLDNSLSSLRFHGGWYTLEDGTEARSLASYIGPQYGTNGSSSLSFTYAGKFPYLAVLAETVLHITL
jgi:hypothetical protein